MGLIFTSARDSHIHSPTAIKDGDDWSVFVANVLRIHRGVEVREKSVPFIALGLN